LKKFPLFVHGRVTIYLYLHGKRRDVIVNLLDKGATRLYLTKDRCAEEQEKQAMNVNIFHGESCKKGLMFRVIVQPCEGGVRNCWPCFYAVFLFL